MTDSRIPDFNRLVLKDTAFENMMSNHIYNILLVATRYDAFILEEDGRIEEQIYNEYTALGLSSPPRFTQVTTSAEALEELKMHRYELIIFMPNLDQQDLLATAIEIKHEFQQIPIVVLTPFSKEISKRMVVSDMSSIDYVFCWLGNPRLILTIVKLVEDKMNAPEDTQSGAQVILLVEDSIRFYSAALPHLYQYVLEQSQEFAKETLNNHQKNLRMRGRPKIMLARNYEEAVNIYNRYKDHTLGVISDMSINYGKHKDMYAGYRFGLYVRKYDKVMPFILESSDADNERFAHDINAHFIQKSSKHYSTELRYNVSKLFGFGDFVIINPQSGEEIMRITDLKDLQKKIFDIPDISLVYHLSHNHFSRFFYSRAMFPPAEILKMVDVSDYKDMDEARQLIFHLIVQYRRMKNSGTIAVYKPERFDKYSNFARIGNDSLGGKGRGLAFLGAMIKRHDELSTPSIEVSIPRTVVICTDIFDRFMKDNNLYTIALSDASDREILETFLQKQLPQELEDDIEAISHVFTGAVAVRSSSLLEDSHYQPFAGVYSTYMVSLYGENNNVHTAISNAIKAVYASTFFNGSKAYMKATGNLIEQEKMSVILQEVVGKIRNERLYPNISGVARSLNYYPVDDQKPEDGICDIALGLGKYIVDGGKALHFSPVHPKNIIQLSTIDSALSDTQTQFYALPLESSIDFTTDDGFNIVKLNLKDAEKDDTLRFISSTYEPYSQMLYDGYYETGRKVISFVNILQHDMLPLASTIHNILETGQQEMGRPVEIEFAVNLEDNAQKAVFYILQIRPIVDSSQNMNVVLDDLPEEHILLRTNSSLGHGSLDNIKDILYVKTDGYTPASNITIAEEIRKVNSTLAAASRSYVLMAPGRWGSSDPWLGIPVKWTDISAASVIVEQSLDTVDPSQGTHFFHNLTSLGVGYFTIGQHTEYKLDMEWLDNQPASLETEHLRLVSFETSITVYMDGKHSAGVIMKP